jgi:hypothetical protein
MQLCILSRATPWYNKIARSIFWRGVVMAWEQNDELITGILEEAGFDVIVHKTIDGIKDEGSKNHQVYVNPKGRIRYQFSEQLSHSTKGHSLFGREFNIDREKRNITNIYGELKNPEELVSFLKTIPDLVRKDETP